MKKYILLLLMSVVILGGINAQKYGTRKGEISFDSDAKLEKIEAINKSVSAVIDTKSNKLQFAVLIKGFLFKKALMQEHFNENYMESSKYPKATFKGKFDKTDIDWTKKGIKSLQVSGTLTLHGVSKEVTIPVKITTQKNEQLATTIFNINLADYDIKIPSLVKNKIAKTVSITVRANLKKL